MELAGYYRDETYARPTYGLGPEYAAFRRAVFGRLLDLLPAVSDGPTRLLDVGCSQGDLLEVALERGWAAEGIEIDPETAHRTSSRLGVVVHAGSAVQLLDRPVPFDVIVMSHWLEHTPSPREALARARRSCTAAGRLLVRVPNAASRVAGVLGARWSWYDPPRHLLYFDARSLGVLAESTGWKVERIEFQAGDALLFPFELAVGLARRTPRPASANLAGRPDPGLRNSGLRALGALRRVSARWARRPRLAGALGCLDAELIAVLRPGRADELGERSGPARGPGGSPGNPV